MLTSNVRGVEIGRDFRPSGGRYCKRIYTHPSGAPLQWRPQAPGDAALSTIPAITEAALDGFLAEAGEIIGAPPPQPARAASPRGRLAESAEIAAALAVIPNTARDWDQWNRIGMATFAASDGSPEGFDAWRGWSAKNAAHDERDCREKWADYRRTPPDSIGAGTLFQLAADADPGWRKGGAEWGEPDRSLLDREMHAAPQWPANFLPPFWDRWAAQAAETASAPKDFVAVSLLSGAGALIGNSRWGSPWPGWAEPPVLNAALVGRPSSNKSPALDAVSGLMTRIEADANQDWNGREREHIRNAAMAKEKRAIYDAEVKAAAKNNTPAPDIAPDAIEPPPPARRRVVAVDSTTEKAARISAANPQGLVLLHDELAGGSPHLTATAAARAATGNSGSRHMAAGIGRRTG